MKEAFYYMFKDNMIKQKALTYFGFIFIAQFLTQWADVYAPEVKGAIPPIQYFVLFILGFIAMFIPTGYGVSCLKALIEQKENPVLPFVNIKNNFILGFKLTASFILLMLSFMSIFSLGVGISFIPFPVMRAVSAIFMILMLILLIPFFIALVIYSPALYTIFAKREWFTTFFRFIKSTKLIGEGVGTYFKGLGLIILLMIAFGIINSIFGIIFGLIFGKSVIFALLFTLTTSVFSTYTVYLYSYITSRAVKHECI